MSGRSTSIDALRGLAVLLVAQLHFLHITGAYAALGAPPLLLKLTGGGEAGVDIFFVLSAYLLGDGLLARGRDPGIVTTFYLRRAWRVLPMYWVVVLAGFALFGLWMATTGIAGTWLWAAPYPPIVYLLFLQNWAAGVTGAVASWFGPTWSLAVEEHFYLLLPLLTTRLGRRALAWVAVSWILAAPLLRMASEQIATPAAAYYWSICRLDSFGWGLVIALALRAAPDAAGRIRSRLAVAAGLALLLATLAISDKATAVERALTTSALAFAAALLTLAAASTRANGAPNALIRALAWCGKRCYSLYLLQIPVLGLTFLAAGYTGPSAGVPYGLAIIATAGALTFILADIAWRRIEEPCMRRAPKLSSAAAPAAPVAQAG
ncbi:MAG: acyltransferase [Rhodoblastus sp.]|nr:acyltransferase [Rhodoblastus sp.]